MNKQIEKLLHQIFRFLVVGGMAFLIDYLILYILTEYAGINYLLSNTLSFTVSVIFNYIMSMAWVFEPQKQNNKTKEFVVFVLLSIGGLLFDLFIMWFGVDVLSCHYMIVKIAATAIVMVYNFITRKIVFEKE